MNIKVNPDWWKNLFDEVYLLTDARSVCDQEITRREVDLICKLLPIKTNHRILDLCGGHGRHCFELYSRGYTECTLLDHSVYLIHHARCQASEKDIPIKCICADARKTKLPSESFDHICIMGNSLGYQEGSESDTEIMKEANRLLRRGGWLIIDVTDGDYVKNSFTPNSWHEIGDDILVCREREIVGNYIHARELVLNKTKGMIRDENYSVQLFSEKLIENLFVSSGFQSIHVYKGFSPHQKKGEYGFMNQRLIGTGRK